MEGRPDRLTLDRRAIGLANLAQDLPLAQDQAFEAGRHPEQMADDPFVAVTDQVPGKELGIDSVKLHEHLGQGVKLGHLLGAARDVKLDPIACGDDHELVARKLCARRPSAFAVLGRVECNRFADRRRRRTMINSQGQQFSRYLFPRASRILRRAMGRGQPAALQLRST